MRLLPHHLRNSLTPLGNLRDPEIRSKTYSPITEVMLGCRGLLQDPDTLPRTGIRMTAVQEKAITLALNTLHVGFFECPRHDYQYFIDDDEWALLMAASGLNAVDTPPPQLALAVLHNAVARKGFFADMTDFNPPAHYCSFLRDKIQSGRLNMALEPCQPGQKFCPYATFEQLKGRQR